jgi:EmrB/QacA subfamily drug resistance transporter
LGHRTRDGRWLLLGALSLASFAVVLEDAAVAVALPSLGADLELGGASLIWVVNSYALTLAALLLPGGRLADRYGRRRMLLVGLAVFALASLLAGVASSGGVLIAARVVQGVGAALLLPATLAIVSSSYSGGRRAVAIGFWAGSSSAALAAGPMLGAVVVEDAGWRWVFLLNVPVAIAVLAVARSLVRERDQGRSGPLDVRGFVTAAIALISLVYGLSLAADRGWGSPRTVGFLLLAVAALAFFGIVESRAPAPLLPLARFRSRVLSGASVVSLFSAAAMCSLFVFLSLYVQIVLGQSALAAGLVFLPMTLLLVLAGPVGGALLGHAGARTVVGGGMLLLAAALFLLATVDIQRLALASAALAVAGVGIGLTTAPLTSLVLAALPESEAGVGAAILSTFRVLGIAVGVAATAAIGGGMPAAEDPVTAAFAPVVVVNGIVAAAAAAIAWALLPSRRAQPGSDPPERRTRHTVLRRPRRLAS